MRHLSGRGELFQPQPTTEPTVIEPKQLESIVTNGFETKPIDVRLPTDNFVKSWIDYASEKKRRVYRLPPRSRYHDC